MTTAIHGPHVHLHASLLALLVALALLMSMTMRSHRGPRAERYTSGAGATIEP